MQATELSVLGLTEDEARVYLAVLELGGSFVSTIAKKAQVHRVVCYKILDDLATKGLVSSLTQNNMKFFTVESPGILVKKQEERLNLAKKLLPELLSITNTLVYKPKIHYYEGIEGIKNIYHDTLNARTEMVGYTNLSILPRVLPKEFIKEYATEKIARKIKTRMLSPHSKSALTYLDHYYPKNFDRTLVEILFVNPKEFMFEYEIMIYGNKTALVSLKSDELIGIMIESSFYADTQRAIFQLAWLGATSFVAK